MANNRQRKKKEKEAEAGNKCHSAQCKVEMKLWEKYFNVERNGK